MRYLIVPVTIAIALLPDLARADLKVCNTTASRVGVSIGYRDERGWIAEGWWNLWSHSCETVFSGELKARYYYIHAVDYDRGGSWVGESVMCTNETSFTINGVQDCTSRGYQSSGFFEIDTQQSNSWVVKLSDPKRQ